VAKSNSSVAVVKRAGDLSGFKVRRVINEPTAAALSTQNKDHTDAHHDMFLACDVGARTADLTLLEFEDGVYEIKWHRRVEGVGADALDHAMIQELLDSELAHLPSPDAATRTALKAEVARCRHTLCDNAETTLRMMWYSVSGGPHDVSVKLTRAKWRHWTESLRAQTLCALNESVGESLINMDQVTKLLMVGGGVYQPGLAEDVLSRLPNVASVEGPDVPPESAIALGAAIHGRVLSSSESIFCCLLLDVTPLSIGYAENADDDAAVHVTIQANRTIPTKETTVVEVAPTTQVLYLTQGEGAKFGDNNCLGALQLPERSGDALQITIDIDPNGFILFSATCPTTGEHTSMVVDAGATPHPTQKTRTMQRAVGRASAGRVSRGTLVGDYAGLEIQQPERAPEHLTATVHLYHTVQGGVPSDDDVRAALDELERLYAGCSGGVHKLSDVALDFGKKELTVAELGRIVWKILKQPHERWKAFRSKK